MLSHLGPRERLGYLGITCLFLFGVGYVGSRNLQRPAPIIIQNQGPGEIQPSQISAGQGMSQVVVHVTGAVKNPGVQELEAGARVKDAIEEAGGATADADLESINLAAFVEDGSQLRIPRKGASDGSEAGRSFSDPASEGSASPGKRTATEGSISINSASSLELQRIPGIGPVTAERILQYRKDHGRFTSIDELEAVPGIGPKKLESMRPYVKL